jgi:hypothetical protein
MVAMRADGGGQAARVVQSAARSAPVHPSSTSRPSAGLVAQVWRLAQAIAEVLAGARPPGQLSEVATPLVLGQLARGAGRFGGTPGVTPPRPVVASVHLSEPVPGVVEGCAVVVTGARRRAIALRLELAPRGGHAARPAWRCTALRVG